MIESLYITLAILAFLLIPIAFIVGKKRAGDDAPKLLQEIILLAISAILFGALAAASADVEFVTCTSISCETSTHYFEENLWIFSSFCLIAAVLAFIKSFDAMYFAKGKL